MMGSGLTLLAVLAFVMLFMAAAAWMIGGRRAGGYPYSKRDTLFSPAERSFLGVLEQAVGEDYRILGQIRIADVVRVTGVANKAARQRAFNRISSKHFDFVLCTRTTLAPVAAIELDDRSHQNRDRQARDCFIAGVCEAAELPLIRVPARRAYSVTELRAQVQAALDSQPQSADALPAEPIPARMPSLPTASPPATAQSAETAVPAQTEDSPVCPKCSSPMVRRIAKQGPNAGQRFWGCTAYPKCRTVMPIAS